MENKKITSALISVYHKDGLEDIIALMIEKNIKIYSTGGTQKFIESRGGTVHRVEDLTSYPSILDGRVKTLHPKVFGGILARREENHLEQLHQYEIPEIDLVVVDLYPFEETVATTDDESAIIEKIDIGGISLIRAAAKNYKDVVVIPSQAEYGDLERILKEQDATSSLSERKQLAKASFQISSHYDTAIFNYFLEGTEDESKYFKKSISSSTPLRYGENPHQQAEFYGNMDELFEKISGKELSFNNLVDVDAAVHLMQEFQGAAPTFAVLKHTNPCGVATRDTIFEAWKAALAGDPVSAFGGILIANATIDLPTAEAINEIFYEVLIAPDFTPEAIALLTKKKKRVLLKMTGTISETRSFKSILNGVVVQDTDLSMEKKDNYEIVTKNAPSDQEYKDLLFALKCVKHLKSNTIVIAKNGQLLGMGSGQTSRVDACNQAILKAQNFGFDVSGAVLASDAFFPFPDCVEIAHNSGINTVIQPGGSINDKLSIAFCDEHDMAMVMTGVRHFKH